ncbi:MAG: hypothetical protein M1400_00645 [Patescibacteria group bacterium]|nr:hypothetical protein [Patescibacteria group bacterium]
MKGAHAQFRANENDQSLKALVVKAATIFGWTPEMAKTRIQELLWEIGLLLGRGVALSEETFLRYATSAHENGFIPVALRP